MSDRSGVKRPSLVSLDGGAAPATQRPLGRVYLVGAGPGDPELLTLKAARLLKAADVVVHDRLISPQILDLCPKDARRFYVGKRKSNHAVPQEEVNRLLVGLALDGRQVVRLKGGDPFIFGRGGEELLACRAAGVPCEVVPGVSAAVAAAAAVGAPLTHRGVARSVTFVTGHAAGGDGAPDLDWSALGGAHQTLVVYMGVSTAPAVAAGLIGAGRSPDTPAVIVENASLLSESRRITTLAGLPAASTGIFGPAVLIIGEAAALAQPAALGAVEPDARLRKTAP